MTVSEARWPNGWRAGLFIELSGLEPFLGQCVVFLEKALYSHSVSLYPSVLIGTGELNIVG